jgi:Flp pilus assembly protein TadD
VVVDPPRSANGPATPEEMARAGQLVEQGDKLYRQGDYDAAERALKEAMTLYPFLAETNILLGKIFLIRASASRDVALLNSARLMFEMARALDPAAPEPTVLLQLFQPPTP